ncbi:hypothetical protein LTR47_001226 [Exophiala xenobiotica]|nr:hypothetical protein LTR47_001226 [Exophiala xenobiotica]KAK5252087.1 hypothetical protein LTS06_003387 [Exophiala xenobiotica]KAK5355885.1 hypothetical protein LTR61_001558 [Exophiala xenobiotica]KAK5385219.1 hypothetical protein LTR11_001592 [Exophiala xenobiotica]KAK5386848.1 hypothetical protein LTS03_002122 [Exophiala xenobiotica]
MASTVRHDSNFPDESYRQRLKDAFVKDCIIEAAIEHLFIELSRNDLIGLFIRAFRPALIQPLHPRYSAGFDRTVYFSWDYGPCPPPDASLDPLQPFLDDFVQNLTACDPETGIGCVPVDSPPDVQEVVEEFTEDILTHVRLMLTPLEEGSESDKKEDDQEDDHPPPHPTRIILRFSGNTGQATAANGTVQSDEIENASDGTIDESDEVASMPQSPDTFGDIINWSLCSSDSRFANFGTQIGVERLKEVIGGAETGAAFCCGGRIPIVLAGGTGTTPDNLTRSLPVVVRFDTAKGGTHKVIFSGSAGPALFGVNYLVQQCQPATFGVGGREVHNQEPRKEVELDATQFSTNIDPYTLGILDIVSKTLLARSWPQPCHKLRAELRNLNVCTGPNGKFKSHIDISKPPHQIGTLVICLPSKHEGGNLVVRHQHRSVTFTWGNSTSIEWAAFYSDLEHEVEEVKSGHRVTLTYNLFWVKPLWHYQSVPRSFIAASLPLYGELRKILSLGSFLPKGGSFLPKGGSLGLYCKHSYIHNRKSDEVDIIRSLKGVDMAFYTACEGLGLDAYPYAVRDPKEIQSYDSYSSDNDGSDSDFSDEESASDAPPTTSKEGYYDHRRLLHIESGSSASEEVVLKYLQDGVDWKTKRNATCFQDRLKRVKRGRTILSVDSNKKDNGAGIARLGYGLQETEFNYKIMHDGEEKHFGQDWKKESVVWLNRPRHEEPWRTWVSYANNEPKFHCEHTYVAILVDIPKWTERCKSRFFATGAV